MRLRAFTPMGKRLLAPCSETAAYWFPRAHDNQSVEEVIIVPPQVSAGDILREESESVRIPWDEIHYAWSKINSSPPGTGMHAWRTIYQYGAEIAPGSGVFRLRDSEPPCYFCLLPKVDFIEAQGRLTDLFSVLSVFEHIMQGRGLLHSAAVARDGWAYLFVGSSGVGKTTASDLSAARGYSVIHDDHVVVFPSQDNRCLVTDVPASIPGIPLKGILFLSRGTTNQLIPISPMATTSRLLGSLSEYGHWVLSGHILRRAFAISAAIARSVPSYELHFRRSPDFWDVIEEEFRT